MNINEAREVCNAFALRHKVIFDENGECGFGRECVGFRDGDSWVDHNPVYMHGNFESIPGFECRDAYAPEDVDSYHKHDCLAVLGRGDEAVIGLAKWVQKMEAAGSVEILPYNNGATGIQALITGTGRRAVKITSA